MGNKANNTKPAGKGKNLRPWLIAAGIVLALLAAILGCWAGGLFGEKKPNDPTQPSETESGPQINIEIAEMDPVDLGQGLTITQIGKYAGIYMEDGSNEVVSDTMMLILKNTGEQDLQLARIDLTYSDFTAEFEVTNLPKGESVVLLEKNRHETLEETYQNAAVRNVVFFQQDMSLYPDDLEITGGDGYLDVKNISGSDIDGDIYVYYKNSAADMLYGGITYRARIEGGLEAGESSRVLTGHYDPDSCRILMVSFGA